MPIIKEGEGEEILQLDAYVFTSVKTAVKGKGMGHTQSSPDLRSAAGKRRLFSPPLQHRKPDRLYFVDIYE